MALTQRLDIRQGQSLVMTPQLQQAIKLLQLSNIELASFVEQELERNPLLEREETQTAERTESASSEPSRSAANETLDSALTGEDFSRSSDLDIEREDRYGDDGPRQSSTAPSEQNGAPLTDWTTVRSGGQSDGEDGFADANLTPTITLKDHLLEQLAIAALDAEERLICVSLIDAVDEGGYLRADLAEIAQRLNAPLELVNTILGVLQGFDPVGVGARDLGECLALQLKALNRHDPAIAILLSHLDLVARRDFATLSTLCGVEQDDIHDMIAEIRALTPRPGLAFGAEPVQPVVPDVYVRENPDGSWHVELNSDTLPRVLVNSRYFAQVSAGAREKDAKNYLTECLTSANWLMKSLDQRARTILKVASEIVRQQDSFLTYGVRHLKPLNLRAIADAISMHESTVSRVTSNKYIATPRGLFELKYFFTAAIQSSYGAESHSAEAVRDRIREMIQNENASEILSDDRIVLMLTSDGVNIARRTVAKYREAMRIPSSVERKRVKFGDYSAAQMR